MSESEYSHSTWVDDDIIAHYQRPIYALSSSILYGSSKKLSHEEQRQKIDDEHKKREEEVKKLVEEQKKKDFYLEIFGSQKNITKPSSETHQKDKNNYYFKSNNTFFTGNSDNSKYEFAPNYKFNNSQKNITKPVTQYKHKHKHKYNPNYKPNPNIIQIPYTNNTYITDNSANSKYEFEPNSKYEFEPNYKNTSSQYNVVKTENDSMHMYINKPNKSNKYRNKIKYN